MKSFQFPLEQVRLWRKEQADVEELKLQKIHTEVHELEALSIRVQEEADQEARDILEAPHADADDLSNLDGFRQYTRTRLKQLGVEILQCQQRADEQRKRLIEKRREFELLDKLKKKAKAEWQHACDKEQEELAAELFLAKRSRDRD